MALYVSGVNKSAELETLQNAHVALNFKVAATDTLVKYNLVNQVIDDFQDASGIDAGASTNEIRDSSGDYYHGASAGDSDVVLLVHGDGDLTDSSDSGHVASNAGNQDALFSTSVKKFGTHSIDFGLTQSGSGQVKVTYAASSDFLFGSDPWSFDCWVWFAGANNHGELVDTSHPTFRIFIENSKLKFVGAGINGFFSSTVIPTDNSWHWIAVQRGTAGAGANIRAWLDGTHLGYANPNANALGSSSNVLRLGWHDTYFGRYMDEVRLSTVARWPDNTNSITVPTAAYVGSSYADVTLISTATTANAAPSTGDLIVSYANAAGAAELNVDLKGHISRNNGSTYAEGTLIQIGTIGSQILAAFHDEDISGQTGSGQVEMRYKITTHNQASNKNTRIHSVAYGWS